MTPSDDTITPHPWRTTIPDDQVKVFIDLAPIGVFMYSPEGYILNANNRGRKMFGYAADGMTGMHIREVIHPDDLPEAMTALQEQTRTGKARYTGRFITKKGDLIWLRVDGVTLLGGELVGFSNDITEMMNSREQLRQSEERLQLATEASNIGVWDWRLLTDEVFFSDQWQTMLGYDPGELPQVLDTWRSLVHPDDMPATDKLIEHSIATGEPYEVRFRMRCKDGSWKWIQARGKSVERDEKGRSIRLSGTHLDIDHSVKLDAQLRRSEEQLKFAVAGSNDGLWDWFTESGETYFDERWFSILGYGPGELPMNYDTWERLVHPDDLQETLKTLTHSVESGEAFTSRYRMRCKDGSWKWILDRGAPVERSTDGKVLRLAGTHTDIDEQVEMENRLRESEERMQLALQGSGAGIWSWNLLTDEVWFSDRWFSMLGYKPHELPQNLKTWRSLMHPEDNIDSKARLQQSIETGTQYEARMRMKCKDGSWKWILGRGGPVEHNEKGSVTRVAGTHTDIDEQIRLEERLKESETRHRMLFENANDGILLMKGPHFIQANNHIAKLYGCTVKEVTERTPIDFSPPFQPDGQPSPEKAMGYIRRAENGEMITFEWVHQTLAGRPFWAEVTLSRIELATGLHVLAIVRDIDERKNYEKRLAASEARWRLMMEMSPYPTLSMTPDGKIAALNKAWIELWQIDPSKFDQEGFALFDDPQLRDNKELIDAWTRAFKGESSFLAHTRIDPADSGIEGRMRHVSAWVYPILDVDGQVLNIIIIFRDITEQIEEEARRQEALDRFEAQQQIILEVATHPALYDGDVIRLAEFTVSRVMATFGTDRCSLWLYTDEYRLVCRHAEARGSGIPDTTGMELVTTEYPRYHSSLLGERAVAADDVLADPKTSELTTDYTDDAATRSLLDSPIRLGGDLAGVFSMEFVLDSHHWTQDEINFGSELADQFAQALLNGQRRRQEEFRKCLYRVAHAAESESSLQDLYRSLHDILLNIAPISEFNIFLADPETDSLHRVFHAADSSDRLSRYHHLLAFSQAIFKSGSSELFNTNRRDGRFSELFAELNTSSAIAQPLRTGDQVFGLLLLLNNDETRAYERSDQNLLQFVGAEIAHAIHKKQAEMEILQHRERLSLAVEGGDLGLWDWNITEGGFQFSEQFATMLGYSPGELQSRIEMWESMLHPDDRLDVLEALHAHLKGDSESYQKDYRLRSKNGEYVWVQSRGKVVQRNADGSALRAAGTHVNITQRKQAEIDRDRLFNLSVDMFSVTTFDGFFKQVNPSWTRTLGWSAQELLKRPSIEYVHEDDRQRTLQAMERLTKGQPVLFFENRYITKGGAVRWLSWNSFPLTDEKVIFSVVRDITESVAAKQTLLESEDRYRSIIDASPMGIHSFIIDEDDQLIFVGSNPASETILGVDYNKDIGKTIVEVFPTHEFTDIPEIYWRVARTGENWEHSDIIYEDDKVGGAFEVHAFQTRQDAMSVMFLDITSRKQSEEEARRLRNLLRNIVNSMPSVLVGVDGKGAVTQWNLQAEKLTGLSEEEAKGKTITDILPQLSLELDQIRESLRSRQAIYDTKRAVNVGGETRFTDLTVYPLITNGIEGAVIRIDDVTDRVRIEEMMVQSEKMLTVGGLAAGMAHEINNPLAGIMQNVQVIQNRLMGDLKRNEDVAIEVGVQLEKLRLYLERRDIPAMLSAVIESGSRATHIVRNMLDFSRKSDQKKGLHQIAEIVNNAIELAGNDYDLKKQYDFRQIHITREFDDDLPKVFCERGMILQVLLNIFKNGAQAMSDKSCADREPMFALSLRRDGDNIELRIADNGPGIDDNARRHIFEPFFTTKGIGKGTGLGLSVSYFIITENHQGSLDVESTPGEGATFIIRLPIGG